MGVTLTTVAEGDAVVAVTRNPRKLSRRSLAETDPDRGVRAQPTVTNDVARVRW